MDSMDIHIKFFYKCADKECRMSDEELKGFSKGGPREILAVFRRIFF